MKKLRPAVLVLLAAAMGTVMLTAWGSIGSAVMAMGLITMGSALLYQRFLNRDDAGDYGDLQ